MKSNAMHTGIILAIVAGLCGLVISGVNLITKDKIAQQALAADQAALVEIFGDLSGIEPIMINNDESVEKLYKRDDIYAYKVNVKGYADTISFVIAFQQTRVVGFVVTQVNDTKGYGSQVGDSAFKSMILSKTIDSSFDLISGATISSTAVVSGINHTIELYKNEVSVHRISPFRLSSVREANHEVS